jgi:hypothetical protein
VGRKVILISPVVLRAFITQDMTWGEDRILRVTEGIPEDARFIRAWAEPSTGPDGAVALLFEHPSWPENQTGEPWPIFRPVLESIERDAPDLRESEEN